MACGLFRLSWYLSCAVTAWDGILTAAEVDVEVISIGPLCRAIVADPQPAPLLPPVDPPGRATEADDVEATGESEEGDTVKRG